MLSGLIYPTSGSARVAGFDPSKRENAYRRIFALVLGQKNQLWWDLPASESFSLLRAIYGLPAEHYRRTLDELVELLGIGAKLERHGAGALARRAHEDGADRGPAAPARASCSSTSRRSAWTSFPRRPCASFLRDYNRRHRVTILLTSHYMADIKELCERVIVIHRGSKIYDGNLDRLEAGSGARQKIITFVPDARGSRAGLSRDLAFAPRADQPVG